MEHFIGLPVGQVEVVRRWRREARCVPLARTELRKALQNWGLSELEGDALLVVSELVTNAVRHAVAPMDREIETRYVRLPGGLRIEVHDVCAGRPEARVPDIGADGGRGLFLVSALADRWAVGERLGPGKRVWAELSVKAVPL
ncbi:ATP-binding protein [Streptomyces sp. ISL-94]|uniref:ATP-binding protein n=1 Tax=Streptomyces sp. ISL-94 TaxID=2819190 RepID=UPI001BEAAA77|nr:ATP-binding protein [Streptomyces sp. ISL-94]MBT2482746.1 ATP-binding protein [Streptomyces sp. ISL-94]